MTALPSPIADYIEASNAHDANAMARPFAMDAVVMDENKEYSGREAIQAWCGETDRMYTPTLEVVEFQQTGADAVLHGKVSGTFPGSPVVLRFMFTLKGNEIVRLVIEV